MFLKCVQADDKIELSSRRFLKVGVTIKRWAAGPQQRDCDPLIIIEIRKEICKKGGHCDDGS